MKWELKNRILVSTQASDIVKKETIQSLWSGYGTIDRYCLAGGEYPSVIVKHIQINVDTVHPRGWNTDFSHRRKLFSYQIETEWYRNYAKNCPSESRIPLCLGAHQSENELLLILEDLDVIGFPLRKNQIGLSDMQQVLKWLANFHARFMGFIPEKLWEIGTYWHLATRPDELQKLSDEKLKEAAPHIDAALNNAQYLTLVHGDAKLANFCFPNTNSDVAAVDFQYVGAGCGMKDVAYFIGSCLHEADCERYEQTLLNSYFHELQLGLEKYHPTIDFNKVETEWRSLFPVAWTDFHRFLKGWSPGHWKINDYSERMARKVIHDMLQ